MLIHSQHCQCLGLKAFLDLFYSKQKEALTPLSLIFLIPIALPQPYQTSEQEHGVGLGAETQQGVDFFPSLQHPIAGEQQATETRDWGTRVRQEQQDLYCKVVETQPGQQWRGDCGQ